MDKLSWKFYWNHYTECFCHVKRLVTLMHDSKISNADAQVLRHIDNLMRENSYTGGLGLGITVSALVALMCSVSPRKDYSKPLFAARVAVGAAILYQFPRVYDLGCHMGLYLGMPEVFDILQDSFSPQSVVAIETQKFLSELQNT